MRLSNGSSATWKADTQDNQHLAVFALGDRADLHLGDQLRPLQAATEEESQDGIVAFALEALPVRQGKQFPRLLPGKPVADALPMRGAPFTPLMAASVSVATSSAESVGFTFRSQNARKHFERVAVGAARLVRSDTVQYTFDRLISLISWPTRSCRRSSGWVSGIRAVGIHGETPHSPAARFQAAASGPRRKSSGEAAGCSLQGWRGSSGHSLYMRTIYIGEYLYRRTICSTRI
jgi:hypothetical protein